MHLQFLGTGAADWDAPNPDGERRYCSSALIDGCLLIDPGPDVFVSAQAHAIDLSGIRYVLNTHRHTDHFCPTTLEKLEAMGARFVPLSAGQTAQLGDYAVDAHKANHGTATEAVHFQIAAGDKRLYYGLDGAWLLYDEMQSIRRQGVDLLVMDGTVGDAHPGDYRVFEHNDLRMVRILQQSLRNSVKRCVVSHLAKTLHPSQRQVERQLAGDGIEVAYDGWLTEV